MVHRLYNLKKLDEIAQGNQEFIREMVVTFVENVTKDISGILSLKSVENWTAIAETSHKLASNFAYLGAGRLHALAADIERSVINERNLTGVSDKTDKLCNEGSFLVSQLKKDFCITVLN